MTSRAERLAEEIPWLLSLARRVETEHPGAKPKDFAALVRVFAQVSGANLEQLDERQVIEAAATAAHPTLWVQRFRERAARARRQAMEPSPFNPPAA